MKIYNTNHTPVQLELFESRLPKKPYCAENLGFTFIQVKQHALKHPYIQPNCPNETHCLVFDIDKFWAYFAWDDLNCPPPSIITRNPANGHCHYIYLLRTPIHHNDHSSQKAIRYLAAIEASLRDKLQADPAYCGLLTKNPIHPKWEVHLRQETPYDLGWIADYLDLRKYSDQRKRLPPVGLGRNCTVFDIARKWAYSERRKPQGWFGYEFFFSAVFAKCHAVNNSFRTPLLEPEVKGIAKSIAKWTWEHMSPEGFIIWSKNTRVRSLEVRQEQKKSRDTLIIEAKQANPDLSLRQLARMFDCNHETVRKALSIL